VNEEAESGSGSAMVIESTNVGVVNIEASVGDHEKGRWSLHGSQCIKSPQFVPVLRRIVWPLPGASCMRLGSAELVLDHGSLSSQSVDSCLCGVKQSTRESSMEIFMMRDCVTGENSICIYSITFTAMAATAYIWLGYIISTINILLCT